MNYTELKLGELLSSANDTIKRNAVSILKELQKDKNNCIKNIYTCFYCGSFKVLTSDGVNGSAYAECPNCKRKYNVFDDDDDDLCRKCGTDKKDGYESLCYDCQMKD